MWAHNHLNVAISIHLAFRQFPGLEIAIGTTEIQFSLKIKIDT